MTKLTCVKCKKLLASEVETRMIKLMPGNMQSAIVGNLLKRHADEDKCDALVPRGTPMDEGEVGHFTEVQVERDKVWLHVVDIIPRVFPESTEPDDLVNRAIATIIASLTVLWGADYNPRAACELAMSIHFDKLKQEREAAQKAEATQNKEGVEGFEVDVTLPTDKAKMS